MLFSVTNFTVPHPVQTATSVSVTTQCNIKTYYQMLQLSVYVPNLCPQPKSSLINRLMTGCWLLDQPSFRLISISHRILIDPLVYHCRDSVIYVLKSGLWNVMKSQIWRYNLSRAAQRFCVCTVCWPAVLSKLTLVFRL